jgi:hypothetical protein
VSVRPSSPHIHRLQYCHDCDGAGCDYCANRGYLRPEFCSVCGEPMGTYRKYWKRAGRPADWWPDAYARQNRPKTPVGG